LLWTHGLRARKNKFRAAVFILVDLVVVRVEQEWDKMKKQIRLALASFVITFALIFAGMRPVTAQTQDSNQDQAQDQATGQDQAAPPDQDQGQDQAQGQEQAQDQDQAQDQGSPAQDPSNRVAELNFTSGSVSFQPGGEGDWVDAVQNRPLTTGDNLWADKDSRAELHVGSTAIRIDSETSLTFLTLNDQTTQLRLSAGTLLLRVRHLDDGDTFEVDTPNLAFDIQRTGEYRIDVNADGNQTLVTVWQGRGEVTGGGYSYDVVADQQARFAGTDQLDHEIGQLPASDDFDNWAFQRDQQEDHADAANYISTDMTGYEDLDAYGRWHYVADYGPVWTPAGIAVDWAPYRNGHWVWIAPWGWTWVEAEPWGFAPFHYGRWAYVENSWCWVPGPVAVRPVYSPAFVAFVGGGGFSLSVGAGGPGVGWFPLGPGEVYVPWYRTSRAYVNNINLSNTRVNVTQVTNVYNIYNSRGSVTRITYMNQRADRGVTVVSRDTFINARPVSRNIVRVDERTIAQAPVTRSLGVQPGRPSVIGAGRPVTFHPPAQIINRQVVGTRVPVMPARPAFEQRPEVKVQTVQPRQHPGTLRAPNQPAQPSFQVNQHPQPLQAPPNPQTEQQHNFPRPPSTEHQPTQPAQGFHPMNGQPSSSPAEHSYVRQAPQPQERNPQQQQNEEQKFHNWQAQRPQAGDRTAPKPGNTPRPQSKAPRSESHDKKSDKR
jgi:Family of unknown function (DUF6600)/FecR protein